MQVRMAAPKSDVTTSAQADGRGSHSAELPRRSATKSTTAVVKRRFIGDCSCGGATCCSSATRKPHRSCSRYSIIDGAISWSTTISERSGCSSTGRRPRPAKTFSWISSMPAKSTASFVGK